MWGPRLVLVYQFHIKVSVVGILYELNDILSVFLSHEPTQMQQKLSGSFIHPLHRNVDMFNYSNTRINFLNKFLQKNLWY